MSLHLKNFLKPCLPLVAAALLAQQPQRGPGGGGTDAERQARFDQFRQQMDTRMKELLRASDEEYAVLKPRIEKIQSLNRANDTRRAGFSMLSSNSNWRTRGSNPGDGQRQPNTQENQDPNQQRRSPFGDTPTTPVTIKTQEMQAILEAKDAANDSLKAKLAELREARKQAKQEMTQLQEELRALCSIRQESVLVMLGILE
jgi:chromosome segregation ATPase